MWGFDIRIRHQAADGLNPTAPERHARRVRRVATAKLNDWRCVLGEFEVPVMEPSSPVGRGEPVLFALFAGGNHVEPLAFQDERKDGTLASR